MNRRHFTKAGITAALASSANASLAAGEKQNYYELRTYQLTNDLDRARVQNFIKDHFITAMKKRGVGKIGCFTPFVGPQNPSLILLIEYASLDQILANSDQAGVNDAFTAAWKEFERSEQLPYIRYESVLLKAFSAHPQIEVPPPGGESGRIFELRTYQSRDAVKSAAKIDMFNQAEIKIFKDLGFSTVFFGEGIFGTRLPHLSYMVAFDNLDAREKGWAGFSSNSDWARIRNEPKWAGTVSNIQISFLRATAFSEIK